MKTITIASQKGGSGKTTLTAHLSVEAQRTACAWIIDTDRQATLSQWHARRSADTPQRMDVPHSRIVEGIARAQAQGADYCFVDTAPTVSEDNVALLRLADLVVIPVRPSPADLWAVVETVAEVKAAGKPFIFVLTQAKPNALITAQAIAALSQHGRVAQAFVADRVAYASSMTGGDTAPELDGRNPSRPEIAALWREIKSCFIENIVSKKKAVVHG